MVVLSDEGKTYKEGKPLSPLDMRKVLKERLVPYKIPQDMKVVDSIPRNAMGKSTHVYYQLFVSMLTLCSQQETACTADLAGCAMMSFTIRRCASQYLEKAASALRSTL